MEKTQKTEAKKQIQDFFAEIKNKSPKQVKKIKRLAMRHKVFLKGLRKHFCKKCLMPYKNPKIRIKNKIKSVTCENCGYASRWKLRLS